MTKGFTLGKRTYQVPSRFDECSTAQVVGVLEWQFRLGQAQGDDRSEALCKSEIARLLSGIAKTAYYSLSPERAQRLFNQVRWAFTAKVEKKPFDYFEHEGQRYYLPSEGYEDTCAIEVAMANIFYLAFAHPQQPNPAAVTDLVATLCRPKKMPRFLGRLHAWSWLERGEREEYNSLKATARAGRFRDSLSLGVVMAVLQYFEVLNNDFMRRYEPLFAGSEGAPLFHNGEGWLALLEDVAEAGVYGNFETVCDQNVHSVFLYLRHKKAKVDRMEEDMERERAELERGY